MTYFDYDSNLALICGRQRKSLTNTTRGDLFTIAPHKSFTLEQLQALKARGGWEQLDDSTGWTHLATLNNAETAEYGNKYAGDHHLHGKFQNGKLRLTWQPSILPTAELENDIQISKSLGRCNTKIPPLRLADIDESKAFFLDSSGKLKAYSYPLSVHTYAYTGFIKPSFSVLGVTGCPRDLLVASRHGVLYFYVTHFVSDIFVNGSPSSDIRKYYHVLSGRYLTNLNWGSLFSTGSEFTSLDPSVTDTLLATYGDSFKLQEKGGFAGDVVIIGESGLVMSTEPPFFKPVIYGDYFRDLNENEFVIPENALYSAAFPASFSYDDFGTIVEGNSLQVTRLITTGKALFMNVESV